MLFAILPPAAREIGLSPLQVSSVFVLSAVLWMIMSPIWGRRSDVIGRKPIILIGLLGFGTSMALLAGAIQIAIWGWVSALLGFGLMIAARSIFGLLGSGTGPAAQAYIADRTDRTQRTAGVALLNAAFGLGQTLGPALGAILSFVALLTPLYFASGLAIFSAAIIWRFLPETELPLAAGESPAPRMSFRDSRVIPFLLIAASLQAVRATTSITLAFFLQDTLGLSADTTVQYAGTGFVAFALAGLFAQLILVQRFRPSPWIMMTTGAPLVGASFLLLITGTGLSVALLAMALMGIGIGLVRPGNAAAASLAVGTDEQGAVAGITNSVGVVGNIFGPVLGTMLYELSPRGPYILNLILMIIVIGFIFTSRRIRASRA